MGELVGVADGVDVLDLGAVGRHVHDHDGVRGVLHEQHRAGIAVDLAVLDVQPVEGLGGAGDEHAGDVVAAADGARAAGVRLAAAVGPQRHVRRQELHQPFQVAAEGRGHEPLGHLPLEARGDLGTGAAGLDMLAGAVGELPHRGGVAADHGGDLGVGVGEDLVQDEHRPLQRGERLQHHQQRERERVGPYGLVGGVGGGDERFGQPGPDVGLAAPAQRALVGERLVHRDAYEVGARMADLVRILGRPRQPGLLQHVLGVGDAAQHVVDDGEQQFAMGGEHLGDIGLHGSPSACDCCS